MGLKEQIENNPVFVILGFLLTGFLAGISGATAIYNQNVLAGVSDVYVPKSLYDQKNITYQENIENCQNRVAEVESECMELTSKKIHIMNTQTKNGENVVISIQHQLSKVKYYDVTPVLVTQEQFESIENNAQKRPDLLIVHRSTFKNNSTAEERVKADSLVIEVLKQYAEKKSDINFLVFSESLGSANQKKEFESKLPDNLKAKTTLLYLCYRKKDCNSYPLKTLDMVLQII